DEDSLPGAVVVARIGLRRLGFEVVAEVRQVEDRSRKVRDLASFLPGDVPRHGERLQIHLRAHNGAAEVQEYTALQILDRMREDEEVGVRGRAERSAVAVGVLVD